VLVDVTYPAEYIGRIAMTAYFEAGMTTGGPCARRRPFGAVCMASEGTRKAVAHWRKELPACAVANALPFRFSGRQ